MPRTFVKDPETGKPAVAVTNYQVIELAELEASVTAHSNLRDQKAAELENARTALEAAQKELDAQEVALNEAKSELESAQGVVGEPTDGVDAETDATSSENTAPEATPADANLF